MKKYIILTILTALGAIPAWSQTTTGTTGTGTSTATTTGTNGGGGELKEKLEAMTPAQRQKFLSNHPEIRERLQAAMLKKYEGMTPAQQQQFSQNHPELAKRLANAGEAGPATKDPGHPRVNEVNKRENNGQQRINAGVANGSLTPWQAARLDKGEARIQSQEARDLAKNNGHLTKGETHRLNREENHLGRRIHRDKEA